jgi:hypothetical protein
MAAIIQKVPTDIASPLRTFLIDSVEAADQINILEVLGRPAKGLSFSTTSTSDVVTYRLNNLIIVKEVNLHGLDTETEKWLSGYGVSEFTATGATQIEVQSGVPISSIEIVSLSLSVGTEIEIVVW